VVPNCCMPCKQGAVQIINMPIPPTFSVYTAPSRSALSQGDRSAGSPSSSQDCAGGTLAGKAGQHTGRRQAIALNAGRIDVDAAAAVRTERSSLPGDVEITSTMCMLEQSPAEVASIPLSGVD
jgi:hypothetical protein